MYKMHQLMKLPVKKSLFVIILKVLKELTRPSAEPKVGSDQLSDNKIR